MMASQEHTYYGASGLRVLQCFREAQPQGGEDAQGPRRMDG